MPMLTFVARVDFNKTIKQVDGAFDIDTSSKSLNCDDINGLKDSQVVRGKVSCHSNDANPTSSSGGSSSASGDSSSSSGVAVPLDMPMWTTGSGLVMAVLSFFFLV